MSTLPKAAVTDTTGPVVSSPETPPQGSFTTDGAEGKECARFAGPVPTACYRT